jgi:hypothetical protein
MKRPLAAAAILSSLAVPAGATGDLYCGGNGVSMGFVYGAGIASVQYMEAAGRQFATPGEYMKAEEEPIYVIASNDGDYADTIVADFSAKKGGPVIATLRTFKATERGTHAQHAYVSGGVFNLKGAGAWTISCYSP